MAKPFTPGDLRERIEHQVGTRTVTHGVESLAWADVAGEDSVPAAIRYESSHERFRAGRQEADVSIVVTVRAEIAITPASRIVWESAAWQVVGYPTYIDPRRRYLRFVAVRTDADPSPS